MIKLQLSENSLRPGKYTLTPNTADNTTIYAVIHSQRYGRCVHNVMDDVSTTLWMTCPQRYG